MEFKQSSSFNKGVCKVALGSKSFTLTMKIKKGTGKDVSFEQKRFSFDLDALDGVLPDGVNLSSKISWYAVVSGDEETIFQFRPAKLNLPVKFSGLARDDEGSIKLFERENFFNKKQTQVQAVAELKVASGKYAGIVYPYYITVSNSEKGDMFRESKDGKYMVMSQSDKIMDLLELTGVVERDPDFPSDADGLEEVLEHLEGQMLKGKKVFSANIEDGYPKSLSEWEDVDDDDEEEIEDEVEETEEEEAPKKSSKRVVKDEDDEEETPKRKGSRFNED